MKVRVVTKDGAATEITGTDWEFIRGGILHVPRGIEGDFWLAPGEWVKVEEYK